MFQQLTNIYLALPQPTVPNMTLKGTCCVCKTKHAKMLNLIYIPGAHVL